MLKLTARLSAGMLLLASFSSFADSDYSEMVIFGDSLSDPGNVFVVTGEVSVRPYDAGNIPSAPYPIGKGKTFSNGATWSQLVAHELKLNGGTGPALRTTRFTNYAFGGARASNTAGGPFDMGAQVSQFLADYEGIADPDALYAVWFGGNDIRDALEAALVGGEPTPADVLSDAITGYATNMMALIESGATDFVVLNAPNVGLAPAVTEFGPGASAGASLLSVQFNLALDVVLNYLEFVFPNINITRVDAFGFITSVVDSPGTYGLGNVVEACLTPLVKAGAICKSPDEYLFWDGIHPTRAGHELLAEFVLDALP